MRLKRLDEHLGAVLSGRYVLLDLVGQGGSGVVYLGRDLSLGRKVAVKLLHEGLSADKAFIRRFHAEAKAAASLNHPSIVRVFDWGEAEGSPFLVFEFLQGGTLRHYLDQGGRLNISQGARVGHEIAQALSYAHARGYVHRDIKPSNLLFDEDGRIRLADFGIARALSEAAWTEPVGALMGTARYASPEQAMGRPTHKAGDLYSFALVMVEAITGELPFVTDTTFGTLIARTQNDMAVPAELDALRPILESLGKLDPEARFSAARVAEDLAMLSRTLPLPDPIEIIPFQVSAGAGEPVTQVVPILPGLEEVHEAAPVVLIRNPQVLGVNLGDRTFAFDQDESMGGTRGAALSSALADTTTSHLNAFESEQLAPVLDDAQQNSDTSATPIVDGEVPPQVMAEDPSPSRGARSHTKKFLILGLLLVVLLSAVAAVFVFRKLDSALLPNEIGSSKQSAVAAFQKLGFKVAKPSFQHDPSIQSGDVVSESPRPGTTLSKGSLVNLVISLGPPDVSIPNVVGQNTFGATTLLLESHLIAITTAQYSETVSAGVVISQTPTSGEIAPGSKVTVTVSSGPAPRVVPNLVGESSAQATSQLQSLGLVAVVTQQYSDTVASGTVISQSVGPGIKVARGSSVGMAVSQGPHMVTVPDLTGMTLSQAQTTLQQSGLSIGSVSGPYDASIVILQNPAAGTSLHYGLTVDVYVSH